MHLGFCAWYFTQKNETLSSQPGTSHTHIIHTYIHTQIHTYIQYSTVQYIHTYIHTYMHTYTHTCIHAYMHTCIHTYTHAYTVCLKCHSLKFLEFPWMEITFLFLEFSWVLLNSLEIPWRSLDPRSLADRGRDAPIEYRPGHSGGYIYIYIYIIPPLPPYRPHPNPCAMLLAFPQVFFFWENDVPGHFRHAFCQIWCFWSIFE